MLLLAVAALGFASRLTADPPGFAVPKTWDRLTDGPAGDGTLFTRNGYSAFVGQEIVKGTEQNRAQSFTHRVYRHKTGDAKPELLHTTAGTHGYEVLLGPRGEVATGTFGHYTHLFVPGRPEALLPKDAEYHALAFADGGLLTVAYRWSMRAKSYEAAFVLFPTKDVSKPRFVRPWHLDEYGTVVSHFLHSPVGYTGDHLVHSGSRPRFPGDGFPLTETVVWDVKAQKVAWRGGGPPGGADARYAYEFSPKEVVRRPIATGAKPERLTIPEVAGVIDFRASRLLAVARAGDRWGILRMDLATGDRDEYDLRPLGDKPPVHHGGRTFTNWPLWLELERERGGLPAPVSGDAETGELRVAVRGGVYSVPVAKREPAKAPPKWEAVPAGK